MIKNILILLVVAWIGFVAGFKFKSYYKERYAERTVLLQISPNKHMCPNEYYHFVITEKGNDVNFYLDGDKAESR